MKQVIALLGHRWRCEARLGERRPSAVVGILCFITSTARLKSAQIRDEF